MIKIEKHLAHALLIFVMAFPGLASAADGAVRIKDLARLATEKDTALVGYGLVTGLAGTGDSRRNGATSQSMRNLLLRFGVNVPESELRNRNAAIVMVTATLPPYSQPGDKLDVNVTSMGDARSLVGGSLMLTPLAMADRDIYAQAQGPVSVGGFSYDLNGNLVQKNHPTAAHIPDGAIVERGSAPNIVTSDGTVSYKLFEPDFATANRIVDALSQRIGAGRAYAVDAARVSVQVPSSERDNLVRFLSVVEATSLVPDTPSRVVVNERTGTVVSGGNVMISPITVAHGNLNVAISTEFFVSQPFGINNVVIGGEFSDVRTQVVPETTIEVTEEAPLAVSLPTGSNVADLVTALNKVEATSRDVITILQAIKRAGALHAELVIQ